MKNSKVLGIAFVLSAYVSAAACGQQVLAGAPAEERTVKVMVLRPGPAIPNAEADKFADCPEHVKANYQTILAHVQQQNADYVSKARRDSETLEDAIKKHGLKRVVRVGNKAHEDCLNLALERTNKQMSADDFEVRTEKIAREYYTDMQKVNVSAPIDFTKKVVIQASHKKIILDTQFYQKLLGCSWEKNSKVNYGKLLASAFNEKEYSEQTSKQLAAIDGIYDALLESRVGFRGLFAGSGINKSRKFRKEYFQEQAKKVYPGKRVGRVASGKRDKSSEQAGGGSSKDVHLSVVVPAK